MPGDFTKDFELVRMDLTNAKGETLGLRFVHLEISVYECLWNNNITCDVLMNDANNLLMNFPIFGYETLDLAFKTPDKGLFEKKFRLHRITDRTLMKEREMGYILHFVTPEAVSNLKTKVSKSYKGKLISDIVSDIHYNWLGGGEAEIEPTKFEHHIIVPRLYPVHAINWLSTRASPEGYEGANYLYYQDKDMYRFVSLESRLEREPVASYLFQVANVRKDSSSGHKTRDLETDNIAVETYTFDNHSDILENIRAGMYGNELVVHSQQRKLWEHYSYDYATEFDKHKHLYPGNLLQSKVLSDTGNQESKMRLMPDGRPGEFPFRAEQWLPARLSQLQQLQNIKLTVTVPGDSDRTVGQVVEFNLPSPEPPVDNKQINDKYYMGKYLVSSVRHKLDLHKYTTTMELVKDSVFEALP